MSNWNLRYSRSLRQEGWGSDGFERNLSWADHPYLAMFAIGFALGVSVALIALRGLS